jgi:hypothetical protein
MVELWQVLVVCGTLLGVIGWIMSRNTKLRQRWLAAERESAMWRTNLRKADARLAAEVARAINKRRERDD